VETGKPARLNALTGLRTFAAINIVLFHFSNPQWFGFMAPVINAGYASVSFFILLSGFVLAYNYADKARAGKLDPAKFWKARFTRLYPIYVLSLILSWRTLPGEMDSHTHLLFWMGLILTPLLLQGFIPSIATFLNTPAWTMSAECSYYALFPWMAGWKRPESFRPHLLKMAGIWCLGMLPGALYVIFNPDHLAHVDRFSSGTWLQALKFTPYTHVASFIFGVMLASLDEMIERKSRLRLWLGLAGFAGLFTLLQMGPAIPYALIHDGLLMPLFGCIILCLAGENLLSFGFGLRPLVFVGEASYCLYLLHYTLWNLIHDSHILNLLHLDKFDPWISYIALITLAILALHLVEKPAQKVLRNWMADGVAAAQFKPATVGADKDGP
jgi:peptidoglycan/LPS O-acetylase OafA/YrhL